MKTSRALLVVAGGLLAFLAAETASAESWPELSEPVTMAQGGVKDAALIIGIEGYISSPDVPGAVSNAMDWYVTLTRSYGIPAGQAVLLRDGEATRESILDAADEAASLVRAGGTLWLVFIGHGAPDSETRDGLLLGSDVQNNARSLAARGVKRGELFKHLTAGRQARTVALLDVCFSGLAGDGEALVAGLQPLVPVLNPSPSVTVMAAGSAQQFAGPLPGLGRPAFSYLALGALRGWGDADKDGAVTPREATNYARDALRLLVRDRQQTPETTGPGSDTFLVTGVSEEGPDLVAMVVKDRAGGERPPATVLAPAPSPGPSKSRGYGRVGLGVGFVSGEQISMKSLETRVNHNNDTIFEDFSLDLNNFEGDVTPLALTLRGTLGQRGLVLGGSFGLLWARDLAVPHRVSTPEDGFSEDVPTLVAGVDGTMVGFLMINASAEAIYRLSFDKWSVFASAGLGLSVQVFNTQFQIDGASNDVFAVGGALLMPVGGGVSYDLPGDLFVTLTYTHHFLPAKSHVGEAGLGFYY